MGSEMSSFLHPHIPSIRGCTAVVVGAVLCIPFNRNRCYLFLCGHTNSALFDGVLIEYVMEQV